MAQNPTSYPSLPLDPWLIEKARVVHQGENEWDQHVELDEPYPGLEALLDEETEFASVVAERIIQILDEEAI